MSHRRLIAHVDMDAFFASVELLRYPELRGVPVVVGGGRRHAPVTNEDGTRTFQTLRRYAGRGVVTTSTYEARQFGVFSAMGMMKAARLAPDAVLLPTDFEEYKRYSRLFKQAVRSVVPTVEDRGIDEMYADLTELPGVFEDGGRAVGVAMKAAVRDATGGLTCSVGITPNKLLSKLCSEFDKPDGLTLLALEEIPARIWPLAARKVNGVGPKAAQKLAGHGLHTVGDIAAADRAWLVETFGRSYGAWLHEMSHGRDDRGLATSHEPKSVSRETTFDRDLSAARDKAELGAIFTHLCEKLAEDLARKGYAAKSIGIKLRYDDFRIATRDTTLERHVWSAGEIRRAAGSCLKRVDLTRRLRLIGVKASSLETIETLLAGGGDGAVAAPVAREPEPLPLFAAQGEG
jgi:DNA polymerase-4